MGREESKRRYVYRAVRMRWVKSWGSLHRDRGTSFSMSRHADLTAFRNRLIDCLQVSFCFCSGNNTIETLLGYDIAFAIRPSKSPYFTLFPLATYPFVTFH
jgi:hypothetical protein